MARKQSNLVTRRPGSANYYLHITVEGVRHRISLHTDNREIAEIKAAEIKKKLLLGEKVVEQQPEMRLTEALGKYWHDHAQFLPSAQKIYYQMVALEEGLGNEILLSQITPEILNDFATFRRQGRENVTVNGDLSYLRAVMNRAALWGKAVAEIEWKKVFLAASGQRERVASQDEQDRFFEELRDDFRPLFRAAFLTGQRKTNLLSLEWRQVNFDLKLIALKVKSKDPKGKIHYVPMTEPVEEVLRGELGNHPTYVFTYVCRKDFTPPRNKKLVRRKGERYPFTGGFYREFYRAAEAAGLRVKGKSDENFRVHDIRHTVATRMLQVNGNLLNVQKLLGHQDISTTLRYIRSDVEDVRRDMKEMEKRHKSDTAKKRRK